MHLESVSNIMSMKLYSAFTYTCSYFIYCKINMYIYLHFSNLYKVIIYMMYYRSPIHFAIYLRIEIVPSCSVHAHTLHIRIVYKSKLQKHCMYPRNNTIIEILGKQAQHIMKFMSLLFTAINRDILPKKLPIHGIKNGP